MRPWCPQLICPVLVRKRTLLAISQDRRLCAHLGHEPAVGAFPKPDILYSLVGDRDGRVSRIPPGADPAVVAGLAAALER